MNFFSKSFIPSKQCPFFVGCKIKGENGLYKVYYYFTFLFFFLFVFSFSALTQQKKGLPYLRNYSPGEYEAGTDNWAILQDKRGVMYFGNNTGVLEYDGTSWRNIPVSNQSIVRSLAMDASGIIYVGAAGEFGYISPNRNGTMEYHSLSSKLPSEHRNFADVWKIYSTRDGIIFQTFSAMFIYTNGNFKVLYPSNSFHLSFFVNNRFFITDRGRGLMTLKNDSLILAPQGEFFADKRTYAVLPYSGDTVLVATREAGLFLFDIDGNPDSVGAGAPVIPFPTEAALSLEQSQVYHGAILSDGSYAFATLRSGVVVIDKKGKLIRILNKSSLLQNENVKYIFPDAEGGLWLALDDGISRAEITSPLNVFNDISGVKGAISDVLKSGNTLFITTSQGVFSFSEKGSDPKMISNECFHPVGNISSQSWDLMSAEIEKTDVLLAATTDGIYEINNNNARQINKAYSFKLYLSKKFPERIFVGMYNGLSSIKYQNKNWVDEGKLEGVDSEIRSIAEDNEGNLWLGMPFQKLVKISFCKSCKPDSANSVFQSSFGGNYTVEKFDTADGLPSIRYNVVFETSDELLFGTDKGLYMFNSENKKFIPEKRFGGKFADGSRQVYCFLQQDKNKFWIYTANNKSKELTLVENGNEIVKPFKRFYESELHAVYFEEPAQLWLGSTNGLISHRLSIQKNYEQSFHSLIRKVTAGKDSVIFGGAFFSSPEGNVISDSALLLPSELQPGALVPSLSYSFNSVAFEFSAPSYDSEINNRFRWLLEGNDIEWNNWTHERKTHYTNLKEGTYRFHLQAQNIYETQGEETVYEFVVLPPWYRTIPAYFAYVLLLLGLIYISVQLSIRRLKAAKERLERIVVERTAEVVKQKEKIESQNHLLGQKNKEITDSINYARRIQEAILPNEQYLNNCFDEYFVLFKPKDIVSGDFYWTFQTAGNKLIWAAVDCTGHGVPGAFMSMIGNSLLNEIVIENKIVESDKILNQLREAIIKSLKQTGEAGKQKDGMDISLCVLDKNTKVLQFSGANNPLLFIRNGALTTYKPDKQPIGYYSDQMKPFSKQEIQLQAGDVLYNFTDGYEDQFGGPNRKKFMVKQLRELLLSVQDKSMKEQKEILNSTITNWMGDEEQIDDICVVGVKV